MKISVMTITIATRDEHDVTDAECERLVESADDIECDLPAFVESRLPANLLHKVTVTVST